MHIYRSILHYGERCPENEKLEKIENEVMGVLKSHNLTAAEALDVLELAENEIKRKVFATSINNAEEFRKLETQYLKLRENHLTDFAGPPLDK